MAQLRLDYRQFVDRGSEIIVVGPEKPEAFRAYFTKEKLPFIGLPDPSRAVLELYGQEVSLFKLGRMPAQVVIDRDGIARFAHYGHSMADIPSNQEMLGLLDSLIAQS